MTGAYKKAAGRKIFKIKQLRLGLWVQILSPRPDKKASEYQSIRVSEFLVLLKL